MKLQPAVKKELFHIALGTAILSLIMNFIFLLIGKWDFSVLWGTLFGACFAILNFLALGITVQSVAARYAASEKRAKATMQTSYTLRMFLTLGIGIVGFICPAFNGIAVLCTLVFPRITILFLTHSSRNEKEVQQ